MFPVYRQMPSYPHQNNPMPFPHHYFPSSETLPHPMVPNHPNFPAVYMPWPHGGNYGYPAPCHVCCTHNGFPAGYHPSTPPCPHFGSPSPLPSDVHSANSQAYPVHYVPFPHYSMVQPRYEYDKNGSVGSHCRECHDCTGDQKRDQSVKIEEMNPDAGKKVSNSLIPVQLGNHPYQVVWIPPDLIKKKELEGQEKVPSEVKIPEISKEQSGCHPLGMKDLGRLVHGGERKKLQDEREDDPKRKFSFPVIWMPYNLQDGVGVNEHKAKEDGEQMSKMSSAEHGEEPSPTSKSVQEKIGEKIVEKSSKQKSIPVKQIEHHEEKTSEDVRRERIDVPVKHAEDGASKALESSGRRQPSSPSKTVKLPPVCLRVDPLPRKKNGNGSSRSPSPPIRKSHAEEAAKGASGACSLSNLKDTNEQALKSKKIEPNKEGRTIQVVDGPPVDEKKADLKADGDSKNSAKLLDESCKEASARAATEKAEGDSNKSGNGDEKSEGVLGKAVEAQKQMDLSKSADDKCPRKSRRQLTDAEAAVLIQSIYRGFEVRRWEPLKKLKQIADIRGQMADVRNHIQALESSEELAEDSKKMVGVGEIIMRLLLQLDSIQGLHPNLREVRKSLARELVSLQERLDSVMAEKSKKCTEEMPQTYPAQPVDTTANVGAKEVQEEEMGQRFEESNGQSNCDGSVPDLPCSMDELSVKSENASEAEMIVEVEKAEKEGVEDFVRIGNEHLVQPLSSADEKTNSEEDIMESVSADKNGDVLQESVQELIREKPAEMEEQSESLHASRVKADSVLDDDAEVHQGNSDAVAELTLGAVGAEPVEPQFEKCKQHPLGAPDSENHECQDGERNLNDIDNMDMSLVREECTGKVIEQQAVEIVDVGEAPRDDTAVYLEEEQQAVPEQKQERDQIQGNDKHGLEEGGREEMTGDTQHTQEVAVPIDESNKEEDEQMARVDVQETGKNRMDTQVEAYENMKQDLLVETDHKEAEQLPMGMVSDERLIKENEELREMMAKLMEAGKEQLAVISSLTGRVKHLEKKLSNNNKKKMKMRRHRAGPS